MDAGALEACSSAERADAIDQLHALVTVTHSQLLQVVAECDRREDWREDGATSMADWLVARLGIAHRTAREWVRVARSLETLPRLAATFAEGGLSFDQLVPVTRLASPETEAAGGSSIAAGTARGVACGCRWQRVAEDDKGRALGLGRTTRQTPRWLARQVRRRDGGCRFPGCARKRWLHSHHLRWWIRGGPTDPDNLAAICGYHHRLVHEGGWRVEGDPEEERRFVHPLGKVLSTRPVPLRSEVRERLFVHLEGRVGAATRRMPVPGLSVEVFRGRTS